MSYEGYEVVYCACGYRKGSHDAYDYAGEDREHDPCPICGSTEVRTDGVDETNGCYCHELEEDERCPAHEQITDKDIAKYAAVLCPTCCGTGRLRAATLFVVNGCFCGGSKASPVKKNCDKCFGTGYTYDFCFANDAVDAVCPQCKGRGQTFKPLYDLSKLNRRG